MRLAHNEGRICFDLFASFVSAILHGSDRIRQIIATMYPVIILDEFQDTNAGQWHVVEALGQYSRLLALADPEQRIYDWIGADPERLNHFKAAYEPSEYDLQGTNHRSAGTDIALFGNHVLTGQYKDGEYSGVCFETYDPAEKGCHGQARSAYLRCTHPANRSRDKKIGRSPSSFRPKNDQDCV
ncbi:UvrD-helicase domain-containing protein [Undibacterium arcticum]